MTGKYSNYLFLLLVCLCFVLCSSVAQSAPPSEEAVARSIRAGVAYLQEAAKQGRNQQQYQSQGANLLCALAMLEGGLPASDPGIVRLLEQTRKSWIHEENTYTISLMILFLDRVGEREDVPIIQLLGVRLYSGQTQEGGWTYQCRDLLPMIVLDQVHELIAASGEAQPKPAGKKTDDGFPTVDPKSAFQSTVAASKLPRGTASYFASVQQLVKSRGRQQGGDNSNTQFGLIALWVAARHGVPAEDAFELLEQRFLKTQSPTDFGWGYTIRDTSSPAMTCAGLLGLAVGAGRKQSGFKLSTNETKSDKPNDPFDLPQKSAGAGSKTVIAQRKAAVEGALRSLGSVIRLTPGGRGLDNYRGHGDNYYVLWSIERMAMAYGLKTIGDQDWFAWGSEYLLQQQQADGSFKNGSYGTEVATAFSILFLCRSNFVSDLTQGLTGQVNDPGSNELRATKDFRPPLTAPQVPDPGPEPGTRPAPTLKTPEEICKELLAARNFTTALAEVERSKGTEFTAALVLAIRQVSEEQRETIREALATRLTRMTGKTLAAMLTDEQVELRRAACLAIGMKDDRTRMNDLVARLNDGSGFVVQAARASLKAMTNQDFGPPLDADEPARKQAQTAWNKWLLSQPSP